MKKKKRANRKIRVIISIVVIIVLAIFVYLFLKPSKPKKVQNVVKIEETIENYGYELADNETNYYKELFKNLKTVLNDKPLNEEKYASLVSQLFLSDFFNLNNKQSKNDVGGLQFVYSDFRDDFEKLAKEGIYHYVESNIYGDRDQKLPIVKEISVLNVEQLEINYLDTSDKEAYRIDLKIIYEEELGYQAEATLYLVHHEDKLEIVKMTK